MVIVESNRGRLGNQLFPYAFSRLLARELNYALDVKPIRGFPNTEKPLAGLVVAGDEMLIGDTSEPFSSIVKKCAGHLVRVHGYFEKTQYYLEHRAIIGEWLAPSITKALSEHTVIHIREKDFVRHGRTLPIQYYEDALRVLGNPSNVLICTDDPACDTVGYFCSLGATLSHGTDLEDFATMLSAKYLVISRSTFSWWAAFLSKSALVVQPIPREGLRFQGLPHTDLYNSQWMHVRCVQ